jgi:hypothetical protein
VRGGKTPRTIKKLLRNGQNPIPQKQLHVIAFPARTQDGQKLKGIYRPARRKPKTPGAFGIEAKTKEWKTKFLAESCAAANLLTTAKRLERAYHEFYATPEGKRFAKQFGKSYQDHSPRGGARQSGPDIDFCDPSDLPQASILDHPTTHLAEKGGFWEAEPDSVHIPGLNDEEIRKTTEIFGDAMRWSLGDPYEPEIVKRGKRSMAMIACLRPDLAAANVDRLICEQFLTEFGSRLTELQAAGEFYGRKLEWMRRGNTFSAYGERLDITAYMLRPDLLPESTLAKLGEILNKSRQAKDKLANCARDTFAGLKAVPMRNDITRARCRVSQLQNT